MNKKRKIKFIVMCIVLVLVVLTLYIVGFTRAFYTDTSTAIQDSVVQVIFNNCFAYEKLGEAFVENSEHDIESEIYDLNGTYSEISVDGYNHIHYLLHRTKGGYYCAAIGNDGLKYLLSLNDKKRVVSFVEVSNLPAKLFEYKDGLVAYYVCDSEAKLYCVDFQSRAQTLLIDGISIADSGASEFIEKYFEDTQKYFDLYEFEYKQYLESGKDLLYTLFDEKCFENVHINNGSVVYRTNKSEDVPKWIIKEDSGISDFLNGDRCFGFVDESVLLFYKCLHLGLYDVGLFYKYDYARDRKFDYRIVFNTGILQGKISGNKEKLYFCSHVAECINFYCMDIETGICNEVLKNCFATGSCYEIIDK